MTLLLAFLLLVAPNEEQLSRCRDLYFSLEKEDAAEAFAAHCENLNTTEPIFLAYKGCAQTVIAGESFNPYTRYTLFTEGKEMVERAVALAPEDPEIRMLRLGIQLNAPGFLGYDEAIDEDLELILDAIAEGWTKDNPNFQRKLFNFIRQQAPVDETQKQLLTLSE